MNWFPNIDGTWAMKYSVMILTHQRFGIMFKQFQFRKVCFPALATACLVPSDKPIYTRERGVVYNIPHKSKYFSMSGYFTLFSSVHMISTNPLLSFLRIGESLCVGWPNSKSIWLQLSRWIWLQLSSGIINVSEQYSTWENWYTTVFFWYHYIDILRTK